MKESVQAAWSSFTRDVNRTENSNALWVFLGVFAILAGLSFVTSPAVLIIGVALLAAGIRRNRRKVFTLAGMFALMLNAAVITALAIAATATPEHLQQVSPASADASFWSWYPVYVCGAAAIFLPSVAECLDGWSSIRAVWIDVLAAPAILQFSPLLFLLYTGVRLYGILFGVRSLYPVRGAYTAKQSQSVLVGQYVGTGLLLLACLPLYDQVIPVLFFIPIAFRLVRYTSLLLPTRLADPLDTAYEKVGAVSRIVVVSGTKMTLIFGKVMVQMLAVLAMVAFVVLKVIFFVGIFAAKLSAGDPSGPGFEIGGFDGFDVGGDMDFGTDFDWGGAPDSAAGSEGLFAFSTLDGVSSGALEGSTGVETAALDASEPGGYENGAGWPETAAPGAESGVDVNGDGRIDGFDTNGDGFIDVNTLGVEVGELQSVDGYMKDDGTFVQSHLRTAPNGTTSDNLNPFA